MKRPAEYDQHDVKDAGKRQTPGDVPLQNGWAGLPRSLCVLGRAEEGRSANEDGSGV